MQPYGLPADLLAPARRASVMMFILGPIMLLCGASVMVLGAMFPTILNMAPPAQAAQLQQQMTQALQNTQVTQGMLVAIIMVQGALILIPGIALTVLAFFVRRGGKLSIILSLVVAGLVILFSAYSGLSALLHPAEGAGGVCFSVIVIAAFVTLFIWLLSAVRSSGSISLAQRQYQAQYWQYQQNMQAYQAYAQGAPPQSLGYPTQPQMPPAAAPPPVESPTTPQPPIPPGSPPSA
jgi:hypothetical protein